ncbi:MAG TPA: hypothetical protein ACFYEK_04075 [Candidatus Wunengus sp. YC60]|uniref:hypothetical protein n=1 Tax=Candidatus Wunengus sp. YC60 TaxID=3367697 RepID=UPI004027ED11
MKFLCYENDERLISENSTWGKWVGIKVNNEKYLFINDDYASHLERVKFILNGRLPGKYFFSYHFNLRSFTKFGYKEVDGFFGEKEIFACYYCSGQAYGKIDILLRRVNIYKNPPLGSKDLKIIVPFGCDSSYYQSPYVFLIRRKSAYCKKCGSAE